MPITYPRANNPSHSPPFNRAEQPDDTVDWVLVSPFHHSICNTASAIV